MGVPRANIVISKVLDHSERRDTRLIERHVIRGADGFDHIAPYSDIPKRTEASIKNLFRRLVILHVEAVRWACSRIIVQVNGDLATGGIITKVLVHVRAGAQQALFLTSPECNTDGTSGTCMNGRQDSHGFHPSRYPVRVIGGNNRRMPSL